ncbi:hypothetical protein LQ318_09610 [Aliifodinibius salicampi]|uniref:DUF481 domain-containing protein n=1 Tax=Fodinibius salicampi TaxID=1920655 RepID=A0ABT3PZ61_9BACT|nr:hypothetical protein [Fodinibius salicampi]MCW9713160.1 hypothetical protein [Fodinibius salicampi]
MHKAYLYPLFALLLFFVPETLLAQDSTKTIDVYLDCRRACDEGYVRDEINFVNYVRNQEDADVHLLITNQRTGSGGEEYTLKFIGGNEFKGVDRTLTYFAAESDTQDEERIGLNRYIKRGLFFYLIDRPIADELNINYEATEGSSQSDAESDSWNYWVFDIRADTDIEGEESEKEFGLRGRISAERITPEWKFEFDVSQFYERQTFEDDEETRTFIRESRGADLLLVKSLSDHWSAGIFTRVGHSTRNNYDLRIEGSPAVEYSVFPYREFTERQITFMYRLTGGYYDYNDITIYGKNSERLMRQQLSSDIEFTQPWGEFEANINASAFLHDFNKNRLDTEVQLDFRVFRGLSFYISGEYAWINNQLSIPAGDITDEEQLLNLRQRLTSYSYEVRFGLEFSFGSIYNNVVNPRL